MNQKGWRTPGKQSPLSQHEQSSYVLTDTEVACSGPALIYAMFTVYIMASSLVFLWLAWVCEEVCR